MTTIRQREQVAVEQLPGALADAFAATRDALAAGEPVVVVVRERDLLGHGELTDAALACALLGLVRALALEGDRDGWRVNVLAVEELTGADDPDVLALLARTSLSGQLLRPAVAANLGRVWP